MLTRTQLKETFSQYGFRPLKRFGENYLIDSNIKDKIIAESGLSTDDVVLEIGPGLGAITIDLAESGASIFAVEKDRKAFAILQDITADRFPNLRIISGDILKFDFAAIETSKKIKVIGNLPYYITTPILEYLIENRGRIDSILVMVQREVANRLLSGPGTKEYSSLSCFVQYYMKARYLHTITRRSFFPEPDVDSSLIRFDVLDKPSVEVRDETIFFKIVRGAFNQRRKSIINSLSRKEVLDMPKDELSKILKQVGIDSSARPETLSLPEFARLANAF